MSDLIEMYIQKGLLTPQSISLDEIRRIAGSDHGLKASLSHGKAILGSTEELDQYLYSYGLMTQRQWNTWEPTDAFNKSVVASGKFHIVDHGCGQGTSLAAFMDRIREHRNQVVAAITLTEPSKSALDRANAIARCYCQNASVTCINKKFDDLTEEDIRPQISIDANIHLLSQVLDIDGYDQFALLTKILRSPGEHHIVALSSDRGSFGGTKRIDELDRALKSPQLREWIDFLHEPEIEKYCTYDTSGRPEARVRWAPSVRVKSGIPELSRQLGF